MNFLNLIKPGIIIGNLISTTSGFLIASKNYIHYFLLLKVLFGMFLIISSSCIFNNIIDRDIDLYMTRTKNRILVKNKNYIKKSIIYALVLGISGFIFLGIQTNYLTLYLSIIGFFIYVFIYSLWIKRKSIYSTTIGGISGSIPPIVGYCSITEQFDLGAIILLLIFSFWQIPHFYAISIYQSKDYQKAKIPTFFNKKGLQTTKKHIIICIIGFITTLILLKLFKYVNYIFLLIMSLINYWWLHVSLYEYKLIKNKTIWARKMFIISIIVIISFNLSICIDKIYKLNYFKIVSKNNIHS